MEKRLTSTWHSTRKNHPIYNLYIYKYSWGNPVVSAMIWPAILPETICRCQTWAILEMPRCRSFQRFISWDASWIFLDHIHDDFDSNIRNLNNVGSFAEKQDSWQSKLFFSLHSQIIWIAKKSCLFWGCICRQDRIGFWWLRLTWSNSP